MKKVTIFLMACFYMLVMQAMPKLVIGIVVDQMRWDYLYRYQNRYEARGGFQRLLQGGYALHNVSIPYLPTYTACGHACIYTGTTPAFHGIVGNEWPYDTDGKIHESIYDSIDQKSPRNLGASTIGDELKMAYNGRSRVYSISLKDRAAILPGGHNADAAFWWDTKKGGWVTSPYYMEYLPEWVQKWNKKILASSIYREGWHLKYPLSTYVQSTTDAQYYEGGFLKTDVTTFPYIFDSTNAQDYSKICYMPQGLSITSNFAQALIQQYHLGKNTVDVPDMLAISFSSTDYMGHAYGPHSVEAEDMYLRLDSVLGAFIDFVEAYVGRDNVVFFLSADHGASPVPAYLTEQKINAKALLPGQKDSLNAYLARVFKKKNTDFVQYVINDEIYLNKKMIQRTKYKQEDIITHLLNYLHHQPEILFAFSLHQSPSFLPSSLRECMDNSVHRKNSGDIHIVYRPYHIPGFFDKQHPPHPHGTTHGSTYTYDTHIPLIFYGGGIVRGESFEPYTMADVAPTVSALLRIAFPSSCIGNPIVEVIPNP